MAELVCMGKQEGWKGNFAEEECLPSASPACSVINVDIEQWVNAELRTRDLISLIQPNVISEKWRNSVVQYVQRLVRQCIGCEVFTYGSVPLKTYLPDGDIDVTAFSKHQHLTNTWMEKVCSTLEKEKLNKDAEFRVKDVKCIEAEVQLVKCIIENVVVDFSFDQLGGLASLCFLEQVNELIGKDNLFKRSIILVKAWCYYESRTVSACHGLLSTYAMEILVLYIFNLFHASLQGPLEVLFRFLDYFGKFDWDNYCVTIQGPIPKSSLPEIAEPPQTEGGDVLLGKDFLRICSDLYSVFPKGQDIHSQPFISKFVNVVDPLRQNNNLGRCVSKGNLHRIHTAFAYGAQKLANALQSPPDKIYEELDIFFRNIWEMHRSGQRSDVPNTSCGSESFMDFSKPIHENGKQDASENASTMKIKFQDAERVDQSTNITLGSTKPSKMLCYSMDGDTDLIAQSNVDSKNVQNKRDEELGHAGSIVLDDQPGIANCTEHMTGKDTKQLSTSFASTTFLENVSMGGVVDRLSSPKSDLLNGDFRNHLKNLAYGRLCQDPVWPGFMLSHSVVSQHAQEHCPWEDRRIPVHPNTSMPSHILGQGVLSNHSLHYASGYLGGNSHNQPGTFPYQETPRRSVGTGTFIPTPIHCLYRDKHSPNRNRHQHGTPVSECTAHDGGAQQGSSCNHASYDSVLSLETGYLNIVRNTSVEKYGTGELSRQEKLLKNSHQSTSHAVMGDRILSSARRAMNLGQHMASHVSGQDIPSSTKAVNTFNPTSRPVDMHYPYPNDMAFPSDHLEFGTFRPVPFSTVPRVMPEQSYLSGSGASLPFSNVRRLHQPDEPLKQEREVTQTYQLKDEDFPPLPFQVKHRDHSSAAENECSINDRR